MKKYLALIVLFALGFNFTITVYALGKSTLIAEKSSPGSVALVAEKTQASILIDPQDEPLAARSAQYLSEDVQRVTGRRLSLVQDTASLSDHAVVLGTLSKNRFIQDLITRGLLNVQPIQNQWDAYLIATVANPWPNVKNALVIVGANKRGVAYGTFELSQQMGVSPWVYWADVPPAKKQTLFVPAGTQVWDQPKIKYRGIFLNDEAPALTNWVKKNHGDYNHTFYTKIFELLLRLKANYLWPAMWNNAFGDDDSANQALAHEFGIVMGTSHHEPMARADKEWNRHGQGPWEYSKNKTHIYPFWQQGVERAKPYETLFTMGMRGQQDEPMSEGENIDLLQTIVNDQRNILKNILAPKALADIPQMWCLYKEVQGFYERGMRVPDDITLLWSDDNWGNIRRLPTPQERQRTGGAGIYYHLDYVGGPRSYRWMNTVPIAKIWEQMQMAYTYGADRVWIVNVGDLKPMEFPTEFFLNLAWNPEAWPLEHLKDYGRLWAEREFGATHAQAIAELMQGYTRHNGRRKPELMAPFTYSLLNFNETQRIESELAALQQKAEAIAQKLSPEQQDAYFQLVLHPILATKIVTDLNVAIGKNRLFATQGRSTADLYGQKAKDLFKADLALKERFDGINKGKWQHFMDQSHIGYLSWNNPEKDQLPSLASYLPGDYAEMGIAVEGIETAWPAPFAKGYRLDFDSVGSISRKVTLFNRGTLPYTYSIKAPDWVKIENLKGEVKDEQDINIRLDALKLKDGTTTGIVEITGTGWQAAKIVINAVKRPDALIKKAKGFIEADGYIAIEAAHFKTQGNTQMFKWQEIPEHGHRMSAIGSFPFLDKSAETLAEAPYVEYPVTFFSSGAIDVQLILAPSLPFTPGRGLRYAISIGDEAPQTIDFLKDYKDTDAAWEVSVMDGVRKSVSHHNVAKPGPNKIRIYRIDPGVVIQAVLVNTGGLLDSYLGPPESRYF